MLGLFLSFLMVLISSYFITSIFTPKQGKYRNCAFLILLGTMFAQIVLNFEILSLFKAIKSTNVLIINLLFFTASLAVWLKSGKPVYYPDIKRVLKRIWSGLKRDKFLIIMAIGFIFFICVSIFFCIAVPIKGGDAVSYHLNRSAFWLFQGSLNHFNITDIRNLIMPINSEILYLWILTFLRNDVGLGLFSFLGYTALAYSLYNILGYFKFNELKKLWSVFVMSAFAVVVIEASSSDTDVMIAGLMLSSVYLFLVFLKEKRYSLLFFSSLMYALAMGTKSPSIMAFPAVFCLLSFFAYKQVRKECVKPLLIFCGFLFLNFMIFSSYNYILNYIDFKNFLSNEPFVIYNQFVGGPKAVIANFVRYNFDLFDFTGFRCSEFIESLLASAEYAVLGFLHIPIALGVLTVGANLTTSHYMQAELSGPGLLGFLLFLPALYISVFKGFQNHFTKTKNFKNIVLAVFALMFFINIFCLSFSIGYMHYGVRYLSTMILLSSPILAVTYTKKNYFVKLIVLFVTMSYFVVLSTNIQGLPLNFITDMYSKSKDLNDARENIRCINVLPEKSYNTYCHLRNFILQLPDNGKHIGLITEAAPCLYVIKMLEKQGYKFDLIMAEVIDLYDLKKYDYIIKTNSFYSSYNILSEKSDKEPENEYIEQRKKELKGSYCKYRDYDSDNEYNSYLTNKRIFSVYCDITDEYINDNGFEKLLMVNVHSKTAEDSNYMTIYKNKTRGIQK